MATTSPTPKVRTSSRASATRLPLTALGDQDKKSYDELLDIMATLERHYKDMCDIEFTVERGKLWMLQTRVGKRTAAAAFRIGIQLVDEGLIDLDEALRRVTGEQLAQLMFPQFDKEGDRELIAKGMAASPGAAVGKAAFDSATAVAWAGKGEDVILVRRETNPDDLRGMIAAKGVLTSRGGKTSHAAVVARGMGRTCVVGVEALAGRPATARVPYAGWRACQRRRHAVDRRRDGRGLPRRDAGDPESCGRGAAQRTGEISGSHAKDDQRDELIDAVTRIMNHADAAARMKVRANADTTEDAKRARDFGAQGIGLCRTEHMFLGSRRKIVEQVILANDDESARRRCRSCCHFSARTSSGSSRRWMGFPSSYGCSIRPCTSSCPTSPSYRSRSRWPRRSASPTSESAELLKEVQRHHEQNPMLGMRGVRLGLAVPGLFLLQVRAIAEAAAELSKRGLDPHPEIMVPLVGDVKELAIIRAQALETIEEVERGSRHGPQLHDRHHDRAASCGDDGPRDRQRGGVLLLRDQRHDADDVGIQPRRRRGRVLPAVPRCRESSTSARSRPSTSRASGGSCRWPRGRARRPVRPDPGRVR